jgi:hypothetical protein
MRTFIYPLALVFFLLNLTHCNSQSCNELPTQFSNYQAAVSNVKSTKFTIKDSVDTSRSSFVESVSFYSCDSKTGFLLVKIKGTEYIHQNVPIAVWGSFKKADSYGSFYSKNIKGRYQLKLN